MEKPDLENFTLKSLKLPNKGGVEIEYQYELSVRDEIHKVSDKLTSSVEPHPDVSSILRSLKEYYLEITLLKKIYNVVDREEFKANQIQRNMMDNMVEDIKRRVKITKVALSGKDEKSGVIITGVIEAETGQGMALNTHRITFSNETYGFEDELQGKIDDLINECYQYMYENKVAEPDMFEDLTAEDNDSQDQ